MHEKKSTTGLVITEHDALECFFLLLKWQSRALSDNKLEEQTLLECNKCYILLHLHSARIVTAF